MFCDKLEVLYADFNDILQYNLVNQNMLDVAGKEYFDIEEQKVLKSVVECNNVGLNIDLCILNKGENLNIVKKTCLIMYLRYTKSIIEKLNKNEQFTKPTFAYDAEDKIGKRFADIVVDLCGNIKTDCDNIIAQLKNYFEIKE